MTPVEETRQLLARVSELAQDDTLSEDDATEMVAGLVGALDRMPENPAWQRVMAKAEPRSLRWPRRPPQVGQPYSRESRPWGGRGPRDDR
jgi:hypothetical protein